MPNRSKRPRNLVLLIAAVTVLPFGMLLWLGWRLVDQDHLLEQQQVRQRLDRAADRAVSALQKQLSAAEQAVMDSRGDPPPGVFVFAFSSPLPEATTAVFSAGEDLELRQRKLPEALAEYQKLSSSRDRAVLANALLRIGRTQQRSGQLDEALTTYTRMATIEDAAIAQVPASLVALYARGRLLVNDARRASELRDTGRELSRGLRSGRWSLTAPIFELYGSDAALWSADKAFSREVELFVQVLRVLDGRRQAIPSLRSASANETIDVAGQPLAVLWRTVNGKSYALTASMEFVRSRWLAVLPPIEADEHVHIALGDSRNSMRPSLTPPILAARRHPLETGLPWPIAVSSVLPPPERASFALRQRLLAAGFFLLVIMSAAAGYLIVRSVNRELTAVTMQADFVAAVSHEFRTPLTTLRQFTDMLGEQRNLTPDRLKVIAEAQSRATERLTRLVESLLDFGRMQAGARRYTFQTHDCAPLAKKVVDDYRDESRADGHAISFSSPGSSPVEADAEALSIAIRNLIDNAAKYSPPHEGIDVAIARQNGDVRISVQDRGPGIPEREQSLIFRKFQRGEQARVHGIGGTGLGLAMVSEIVRAHRGRVELVSAIGRGSTFTIVLPAKE